MERDIPPPVEIEKMNQIFTSIVKVDQKYVTIYVNNTGNFPIRSIEGYIFIFVLYYFTKNATLASPINDTKDDTILKDFQNRIKYITKIVFKPSFNSIDNVASKAIKVYP